MPNYASESEYFSVRQLNEKFGFEETSANFELLCATITKTINAIPGLENLKVTYRNVLERTCNPDGTQAFFRVTNYDPNTKLDVLESLPEVVRAEP